MCFFIIGSMFYCLFAGIFFFWDGRFDRNELPFYWVELIVPLIPLLLVTLFVFYRD